MKPKKYNSECLSTIVLVESRRSKLGDVFFCVNFTHPRLGDMYVTFESMSSVIDFLKSNF